MDELSLSNEEQIARLIKQKIQAEFAVIHLSGNLADTVEVKKTRRGWSVEIPAQMYNVDLYRHTGAIVYDEIDASYAAAVDETGGFSGTHVGFIGRCIKAAVQEWAASLGSDKEVKLRGE